MCWMISREFSIGIACIILAEEKIGILFNFYRNKILSFPDNAGKNEGSEIHSCPEFAGKYMFSCLQLAG